MRRLANLDIGNHVVLSAEPGEAPKYDSKHAIYTLYHVPCIGFRSNILS